ncbi:uncharacterized protein SPPG_08131 [Spizellomyces punctatus DAOM BR117]|uniref:FZ domain-containing protein n=1 Tax=Spizellomyces punctatus (strain DAOM BR117) TaxID=645134 RepID=A0A0L0H745_SPIPD|nr:uncharacterized protein SPPG_08131 [Spizellomyces punctatus DAOM BR117]KNC96543.1 hypothetical protein SPPG_08131 [Spizellomyces punctatus DAOM BR117]|eukprot:XP_016604583.1 hypothetical protein SPPG_08131 [Spizellomyces punctatus DAOM BR117]
MHMKGISILLGFLWIGSTTAQQCTGNDYSGTCGIVGVDYKVLTPAAVIPAAEAELQQAFEKMESLKTFAPTCFGYLKQAYCALFFPGCVNGVPAFPCENTCKFAVQACGPTFALLHLEHLLPDCTVMNVTGTRMPLPTQNCLAADAAGARLGVKAAQPTSMVNAQPAEVYREGSMSTSNLLLLVFYGLSILTYTDTILTFMRMRRSYSLVSWAATWLMFIFTIMVGQILYRGDIHRAFNTDFCRIQALVQNYFVMSAYIWPFFFTLDVWFAVVRRRLRATSEGTRWKWNAPFAILLPAVPTVILAIKANPVSVDPPFNLQPGFGPHVLFCSYLYPVNGWAMSTLPFVGVFALAAILMGVHAAFHLWQQRQAFRSLSKGTERSGHLSTDAFSSDNQNSTSSGMGSGSQGRAARMQSKISAVLCARVLGVTVLYFFISIAANYQQLNAVIQKEYSKSDQQPSFRDFSASLVGPIGWLILCTSSATWSHTIPGSIIKCCKRRISRGRISDDDDDEYTVSTSKRSKSKSRNKHFNPDDDRIELRRGDSKYSNHTSLHRSASTASHISGPYNVHTTHPIGQAAAQTATTARFGPVPPVPLHLQQSWAAEDREGRRARETGPRSTREELAATRKQSGKNVGRYENNWGAPEEW